MVPGEKYVQTIIDLLENVETHGSLNMQRLMSAIKMLENLRDDVIAHKGDTDDTEQQEVKQYVDAYQP